MVKYLVSLPPNPIKPWHEFIYWSKREYYAPATAAGQCHHCDGPFMSWSGAQTQSKEGSSPPFCPPQNLEGRSSLLLQISRSEASLPSWRGGVPKSDSLSFSPTTARVYDMIKLPDMSNLAPWRAASHGRPASVICARSQISANGLIRRWRVK